MTDDWGVKVVNVELKDILIPDNMKRTIAKEAEAERERRAVVIKAIGEVEAAENMAKAANLLNAAPGALHLRTLQSVNDLLPINPTQRFGCCQLKFCRHSIL